MLVSLNLRCVEERLQDHARLAFQDGDAHAFVFKASCERLQLVVDNFRPLKERGIYEQSLLAAFTSCRVNHHEWSDGWMDWLFGEADPIRLRQAGEPLPGPGPFHLYRGIAGTGRARRLRGYSWTRSLEVACWFATRLDLPSPAVLTAEVSEGAVLAYHDVRSEQEFICKPRQATRMTLSADESIGRARVHAERLRIQRESRLAELIARAERPAETP
ncbi:hypothetical protein SAMN05444166_7317 [Singulisphaera sp. GP187]|nr:hypothetical protein SAMN05444166_7317 [Singulisphaera sp. GP187]